MRRVIITKPPATDEDKLRWDVLNSKNYEKLIWESISKYNFRAQLDIANLIYKKIIDLRAESNQNKLLINNLALRLVQLLYETSDQFALIHLCIIEKDIRPVYETYVVGSNTKTRDFFTKCVQGKINKRQILAVWGMDKLKPQLVANPMTKANLLKVINDTAIGEKGNLKIYGNQYVEYDKKTKKSDYSGPVRASFAVKHGFKQVLQNELSKKIWNFNSDDPSIIQEIVEITRMDNGESKHVMKVGSLFDSNKTTVEAVGEKVIRHIKDLSRSMKLIATIQNIIMDDPYGALRLFATNHVLRIGRNELCPCNSGVKWKRCHGRPL